mmetsp:Transcript_15571/g.38621  ORF Transcript_15571/g.38621 Transcript_15571/m.38621 type:complete len:225 (+) Transcript_15571:273-947(+)
MAVKITGLWRPAAGYHVDALIVGGHVCVCRKVLGGRNGASLYACDAPDTDGRSGVKIERVGIAAAIGAVRAAAVVGIGVSYVVRRDAVGAARENVDATLEFGGGRVEVGRRIVGAPVDGGDASTVIRARICPVVRRGGVGAARNGKDALQKALLGAEVFRARPVVGRLWGGAKVAVDMVTEVPALVRGRRGWRRGRRTRAGAKAWGGATYIKVDGDGGVCSLAA